MQYKCNKSKPELSLCPKVTPALFPGLGKHPFSMQRLGATLGHDLPSPTSQAPGSTDWIPCFLSSSHPLQSYSTGSYHLRPGLLSQILNGSHDGHVVIFKSSWLPVFWQSQSLLKTLQCLSAASSPLWDKQLIYKNLQDLSPDPFPACFLPLHFSNS